MKPESASAAVIFLMFIASPVIVLWMINRSMRPKVKPPKFYNPEEYWSLSHKINKPSRLRTDRYCMDHSRARDIKSWCVIVDKTDCDRCKKERK